VNFRAASDKKGIFMQIEPKRGNEKLRNYVEQYFKIEQFKIEWKSPERFIQEDLWKILKAQQ
jgi:hypothetical protein